MRRVERWSGVAARAVLAVSLAGGMLAVVAHPAASVAPSVAASPRPAGAGPDLLASALPGDGVDLPRPARGETAIRLMGDQKEEAAARNDLRTGELVELLRTDPTAWLSTDGLLHHKEPASGSTGSERVPAATYPDDQTLALHSKPDSQRTIFLDFDGATVSGTHWHAQYPGTGTKHPAWDPSGNGPAFDASELARIQAVWTSVAEDYAPFDVDVTTADPGPRAVNRASSTDPEYGAHVLISPSSTALAAICGAGGCGGVGWVGVFAGAFGPGGTDYGYGYVQPSWVFPQALGDSTKHIAEAASHEVGHNLGLGHDGNQTQGYDAGHGVWAPLMGVGYERPVTQWSRGEYVGANNPQDDLAVIESVLGLRTDEAPAAVVAAPLVPSGTAYVTSRSDVDTYRLGTCSGPVTVTARPLASQANLDLGIRLLDGAGTAIASADPPSALLSPTTASGLAAQVGTTLAAGDYHVSVDGVGHGPWSTGYDDYGSLGGYSVSVAGDCEDVATAGAPGTPGAPTAAAASGHATDPSVTLTWSAPADPGADPVTGYVVSRSGGTSQVRLAADATSHTWTDLAPGTSYTFRVAAVNGRGVGATARVTTATPALRVPVGPVVVGSRTRITTPRTVRVGSRAVVTVQVVRGGAPATGRVVVTFGGTSRTLTLAGGTARLVLPRGRAGWVRLVAGYVGNATTGASSARSTVSLRR